MDKTVKEEDIACDWQRVPTYVYTPNQQPKNLEYLEQELQVCWVYTFFGCDAVSGSSIFFFLLYFFFGSLVTVLLVPKTNGGSNDRSCCIDLDILAAEHHISCRISRSKLCRCSSLVLPVADTALLSSACGDCAKTLKS